MTRNKRFSLLLVAAGAVCAAPAPARAQVSTEPPIIIKQTRAQEPKPVKTRFAVLHMMPNAIQVRSLVDEREIHTFTYSAQIRDQMLKLLDRGGYQFDDKVEIEYKSGTDVALKIKGKPSKPI
jgi:hypothetical protein